MKLPAYGRAMWDRRIAGERIRVVALLVGDRWQAPKWLPAEIPRVAVKNAAWNEGTERFDWRVVAACTVLAIDNRGPGERIAGPDGWDAWFWLLAQVQQFARDVLRWTPVEDFRDPPGGFDPERTLETFAWCESRLIDGVRQWPVWWPHGNHIFERDHMRAAA